MRLKTALQRFCAKVVIPSDPNACWLWRGKINPRRDRGYGAMGRDYPAQGKWIGAHIFSYKRFVGPIIPGLTIDHLCNVRHCVNPAHLEQVTRGENARRGHLRRTHCKRGHPFAGENLIIRGTGVRMCRICRDGYWERNEWRWKDRPRKVAERSEMECSQCARRFQGSSYQRRRRERGKDVVCSPTCRSTGIWKQRRGQ